MLLLNMYVDIEALEMVHKRATKILPALRHLTYPDHLKACKLSTFHYRQIRGDMIETYKIIWLDCSLLGAIGNALYESSGQST